MTDPGPPPATEAPAPGRKLGARLRCPVCGSQAVVTKASASAQIHCHGKPLETPGQGTQTGT